MHRKPALRVATPLLAALVLSRAPTAAAEPARIVVRADRPGHRVSRYLTGACIEDVNHEIYGGIYSQMLFGESFQEPPPPAPIEGFRTIEGSWRVGEEGEIHGDAGPGHKLVSERPAFADGEVSVEVRFEDRAAGNAGLIVRVGRAAPGADAFDGYEVSLDPSAGIARLGRHRHDWTPIRDVPCEVPVGTWIPLSVRLRGAKLEVLVGGRGVMAHEDRDRPLLEGTVGLRQWQRAASYRRLEVKAGAAAETLEFRRPAGPPSETSGMWRLATRGSASGSAAVVTDRPFVGSRSQRLAFESGEGTVGLENRGLNRQGIHFQAEKRYEGLLWARAAAPIEIVVALESADGSTVGAEAALQVPAGDWRRVEFALEPRTTESRGRFAILLPRPGTVDLGHAFLQPGDWGRFRGLPVRRDVAEALIDQGITVLRYGGSMVNCPEYRWKDMIGPRDRRPPYRGTWYPWSTNGWGIIDFIDLCDAAGFLCIPAFHMGESPRDMADFVEYVNGPPESEWGRRRVADGRREPYRLRHLQLGNEERVDDAYFEKFRPMAEAIWAKDPDLIIVVGDFVYTRRIDDPFAFTGSVVGLTSLAAHQKILRLAKERGREVWFDLHVGTDGPLPDSSFEGMLSFVDALGKVADGARHRVVVFEFNAGNHSQRRALANALAIHAIERDGRIPIATSANCLQVDGQNDNGWDQGLLFLNPSSVWLQPPGWVTRMVSRSWLPVHVPVEASGAGPLDASAKLAEDAKRLVLGVVNPSDRDIAATIELRGFAPASPVAEVEELSGPLDLVNTAEHPDRLRPAASEWRHGLGAGPASRTFPARSFTVIRMR